MKNNKSRKWVITISLTLLIVLITSAVIGVVFYLKNKKKNDTSVNNDSYIIQNNNNNNNNYLKEQPNSTRSFLNQKTICVGHWNVLNQGGINQLKNEALAKVILKSNVDVIALTEINSAKNNEHDDLPMRAILKELNLHKNQFDQTANWNYVLSKNLFSKGNESQTERIGFFYKANIIKPVQEYIYKNNDNKDILFEQYFKNSNDNTKITYSRPPYAYEFQTLDNKFNFTIVASHLDSPGANEHKTSKHDHTYGNKNLKINIKQGSKELNEAYQLGNVMDYIDRLDGNNDDLIFVGDTNIKTKNELGAFASLYKRNYLSNFKDDNENNKTTLAKTYLKYAQHYDKIFTSPSIKVLNTYKYDLWSVSLTDTLLDKNWKLAFLKTYFGSLSNQQMQNIVDNWDQIAKSNDVYIKKATSIISDHTLVAVNIKIDENDIIDEN
ncbi:endonuclease/exonuclease/phosphatase family protein [Ureaplasma urealyticum]|uniref:endonuclease/exonuclease/phosphatase family protein n=1 Tax=Ureaplasma urealyticum TaxID=2130 RepID=UPI00307D7F1D